MVTYTGEVLACAMLLKVLWCNVLPLMYLTISLNVLINRRCFRASHEYASVIKVAHVCYETHGRRFPKFGWTAPYLENFHSILMKSVSSLSSYKQHALQCVFMHVSCYSKSVLTSIISVFAIVSFLQQMCINELSFDISFDVFFLITESTSVVGEGHVFPTLQKSDRVPMIYAVFQTPRLALGIYLQVNFGLET